MGKYDDAFDGVGGTQEGTTTGGSKYTKDDYQAFRERTVEVCGTQTKKKSMSGYISGIIWLGNQPQQDAQMPFTGTEEDERAEIAKNGNTYFKTAFDYQQKKDVRYKCWPQKPRNSIAITVDFPKLMVAGLDGVERPVRMLLNGEFVKKGTKAKDAILNKLYDLRYTRKTNSDPWTLNPKGLIYKLAVATEAVEEGSPFVEGDLGKLIGKYAQFELRAFFNEDGFYNERISFKGSVPEEVREIGLPEVDESTLYFIRFDKENDPDAVKVLRSNVVNQIMKALDYDTSTLKAELEATRPWLKKQDSPEEPESPPEPSEEGNQGQPAGDSQEGSESSTGASSDGDTSNECVWDDDIPF